MVKDAYKFALPPIVVGLLCLLPGWKWAAGVLIFLGLFIFYFFRDPERDIPADPGSVVSPADGHVVEIVTRRSMPRWATASAFFFRSGTCTCSGRPSRGAIADVVYRPGKFYGRISRGRVERKRAERYLYAYATWSIGFQTNRRSDRATRAMLEK